LIGTEADNQIISDWTMQMEDILGKIHPRLPATQHAEWYGLQCRLAALRRDIDPAIDAYERMMRMRVRGVLDPPPPPPYEIVALDTLLRLFHPPEVTRL